MTPAADPPASGWLRLELRVRPATAERPWCAWLRAGDAAAAPLQFESPFELVRHLQALGLPTHAGRLR